MERDTAGPPDGSDAPADGGASPTPGAATTPGAAAAPDSASAGGAAASASASPDRSPTPATSTSATEPPRVEIRNLTKRYGSLHALRGVDLSLRTGEVVGLVGDNGAGKSTLVNIISG